MTSISKTVYASGAEVEVHNRTLSSGEFVQLKINYESMDSQYAIDSIIVTLNPEVAKELANAILKL
jgi:hypothetical protein